jgi:hypothetical protein
MTSSLLRRRLCIMTILAASLLFLPLTLSANNNNNNSASAQTPHCNIVEIYDVGWCLYEREVENIPHCIEVTTEYNKLLASYNINPPLTPLDVSEECALPDPPPPLQPLDCNELGTCPTQQSQPIEPLCPPSLLQSSSPSPSSPSPPPPPSPSPPLVTPAPSPSPSGGIWERMIKAGAELGHTVWELLHAIEHAPFFGPLPPFFPKDLLNPWSQPGCTPSEA